MFARRRWALVLITGLTLAAAVFPWTKAVGAEAAVSIGECSNLDPASAADPLLIPVTVKNFGSNVLVCTLTCEVLDYWFRPQTLTRNVTVKPGASAVVKVAFDPALRARLFKARYEAGAQVFRVNISARRGKYALAYATKKFAFKKRIKDPGMLPPLAGVEEYVDDLFGKLKLVDEVKCYDPADPHPYIEGGRGLDAKETGAVPQYEWKTIYREKNKSFAKVENVLGQPCRVTQGWGWFGYKLNREGLTPGKPYLLVVEYPEDVGRTVSVVNSGNSLSYSGGHGFHTGRTLGDHWTRAVNSEYVNYPLSGQYRKYYSFFHLRETVFPLGGRNAPTDARKGFWVMMMGVGPSMDALDSGAAVRSIKLYEVADVSSLFLNVNTPPLELGRRALVETSEYSEYTGANSFREGQRFGLWTQQLLHRTRFYGMSEVAPNDVGLSAPLLDVSHKENLGIKVLPRVMMERDLFRKIDVPKEACVVGPDGRTKFIGYADTTRIPATCIPDIVHPATLEAVWTQLDNYFDSQFTDPAFSGVMFYKHHGLPFMPSFSDYAMGRFEKEVGVHAKGADSVQKRKWLVANKTTEYYQWWYAKEREFLLAVRDQLQAIRPDLKLYYFPWHSDDTHPFSCMRLRYFGYPLQDKIYVPGTNILLVPGFAVPPEKWTPEEKANSILSRKYYRERIAPELAGKVTFEDIIYGRYKDRREFWGAKRSGELPHLVYPEDMDMIKMLSAPGVYSAFGTGCNPRLYANDKGIVYWAPVHYKYTADNSAFLNFFKTGEGVAVGNSFPYNEESFVNNCFDLQNVPAIEHAGPFCMMEEILSMANADPSYILENKWEPLERGFPQYARAFAAAYLALPAAPSDVLADVVEPPDKEIVVRQYKTDYGTYLAVISRAFDLKERRIAVTVKIPPADVATVQNLVTGKPVAFEPAGPKNLRFAVTTRSMQLQSFRVVPKTPVVVFRDVQLTPPAFSPNGDGRSDQVTVSGRTVDQITEGTWKARITDGQGKTVRDYAGNVPEVRFVWDGKDKSGAKCADGAYTVLLASSQYAQAVMKREVVLATTPPAATVSVVSRTATTVNRLAVEGTVARAETGSSLLLIQEGRVQKLIVWKDGTFRVAVEGLNLGDNVCSFVVEDRVGNRSAPRDVHMNFGFPKQGVIGFDFGSGPIMDGFSGIRAEAAYTPKRGYGWVKPIRGDVDRFRGDKLVRDYGCGGKDTEWAVKLPNGKYRVAAIMGQDTQTGKQFRPKLYVEGREVADDPKTAAHPPYRPNCDVEVTDGVMNFEFKNPGGKLPYWALNGIVIESRP